MSWLEIHIATTAAHVDLMSDQLSEHGALAVTFQDAGDDPIYEPARDSTPVWQHTIVTGLFAGDHPLEKIIAFLNQQQANQLLTHFHVSELAEDDWISRGLEHFKPLSFGSRLWICPTWHTPPAPAAVNVLLNPGLAFGTGTHPTTALCLQWLDQFIHQQEVVVDYGCGSGILGIAALKLGAKQVFAVDNDEQALTATLSNAEHNQLTSPRLQTFLPNELIHPPLADILIANILAQPLIKLAPYFKTLLKPEGKILLSGILPKQVDEVMRAYQPWIHFNSPTVLDNWARLDGALSTL